MFNHNPDFYPTSLELSRKMLNKINLQGVKTILEPSAGKGDLIEAFEKHYKTSLYYNRHYPLDADLIELDDSLIHILKGKGYRVVHNDFLSYNSYKSYDVILANFPFSAGDKHTLKAIELMETQNKKCQLVCLINAETLKNPYSNIRKELINKLEKYDAEVEFIENAFVDAERKTGVEIALVSITVDKQNYESVIIKELKKEEQTYNSTQYNSDKLIHNDFIEGIVSQYNYEVKAGLKLIQEYNSLKVYMLRGFEDNDRPVLNLELDYKDRDDNSSLENAYIKQIRQKYWKALFSNDQFIGMFTSNLKRKYMDQVNDLKDYDFSLYNIYTLRIQISKEMVQGVEDTILSLFEELSHKYHYYDETSKNVHYFSGWKTNQSYKINKKAIIPLDGWDNWMYHPYKPTRYQVLDKLQDIEKVFNYLDGGNTEELDMKEALKFAEAYGETKKIELKYFYVTFYKKGTCHIEFKSMELLHKFNLYGSQKKGWLPPSYGKAKYKDMTREEKEVINEFEGEQSYNKVMANKGYYIVETSELLKLTS